MGIKVPDRYGFWRCDGKNKRYSMWQIIQVLNLAEKFELKKREGDCPYKDKCWRTKDIETQWITYSNVCGEWNDYHWFWGDTQTINRER